jgi:hypothetical protein
VLAVLRRRSVYGLGRKGRIDGVARILYGLREREGEAENGAAAGALSIDGRRCCGIKEEGKRGNRKIWRGNRRGDHDS